MTFIGWMLCGTAIVLIYCGIAGLNPICVIERVISKGAGNGASGCKLGTNGTSSDTNNSSSSKQKQEQVGIYPGVSSPNAKPSIIGTVSGNGNN